MSLIDKVVAELHREIYLTDDQWIKQQEYYSERAGW
jgi:hypothetical protein